MKSERLIMKIRFPVLKISVLLLVSISIVLRCTPSTTVAREILPVLEFPQEALDDASSYRGYTTRFFQDSEGNALQVYLNQREGRVVHTWANAVNESAGFTARDTTGQPAILKWASKGAEVGSSTGLRYVEYRLTSESAPLRIGRFLLGSMRKERDVQSQRGHLLPFDAEPFLLPELVEMIANLESLPGTEQRRHLALLGAKSIPELQARLLPEITLKKIRKRSKARVEQLTFDGKNRLTLELSVDPREAVIEIAGSHISVRSLSDSPLRLTVRVATDSPALTPLGRDEIFNDDFREFYHQAKAEYDSLLQAPTSGAEGPDDKARRLRFRRLDRHVRSMELLSSREKLMAGLPNYGTYFGRDMMMAALMMEPIWSPSMLEHVIASVLKKLTPSGLVSHEEALGGQAIRENAARYNELLRDYFQQGGKANASPSDSLLVLARSMLENLQSVRENYNMVDDDFQLPVLAARYLARSDVPAEDRRSFLLATTSDGEGSSRLSLLMRNLLYVANITAGYAEHPAAGNLVSFPKRDEKRWSSGSWRDSGAGYANGRFAMDINAIWVPQALEAIGKIFNALRGIGFTIDELESLAPEIKGTKLAEYARSPEVLSGSVATWGGAVRLFRVELAPKEIHQRLTSKLNWLTTAERTWWKDVLSNSGADKEGLEFLALSLDADGQPIPVVNTDPATLLFLEDFTEDILAGKSRPEQVLKLVRAFLTPYPVGLFVAGLGPLVANDAYAPRQVWENFRRDHYHSPRVVWGREVNLVLLGLAKQISAAFDSAGELKDPTLGPYIEEMNNALNKILTAVESSGLKHNELWTYRIEAGKLSPVRYPTSTDIQLWNVTDLAVQTALARIRQR